MRRVEVRLPPAKRDEVRESLADIGIDAMTLAEVRLVEPPHRKSEYFEDRSTSWSSRSGSRWGFSSRMASFRASSTR